MLLYVLGLSGEIFLKSGYNIVNNTPTRDLCTIRYNKLTGLGLALFKINAVQTLLPFEHYLARTTKLIRIGLM